MHQPAINMYILFQNIELRLTLKSLNSENANIKVICVVFPPQVPPCSSLQVSVEVLMSRIKKKEEDMKARRASMEQAK